MKSGATRSSRQHLRPLGATVRRRTVALAVTTRRLQDETTRCKTGEANLRQGARHHNLLLAQSRCMQKELRRLAHQILSAQERSGKKSAANFTTKSPRSWRASMSSSRS
jgi:hypothetical protein